MHNNSVIKDIKALEIFDSRGHPTVEVMVELESGIIARASVPSGASTGSMESVELRDGGKRLSGKGVSNAVNNVNTIIKPALVGIRATEQYDIDMRMTALDPKEDKSSLGSNALLGVSLAVARAASLSCGLPLYRYLGGLRDFVLPVPLINVINGGMHADNALDIQECMIMPVGGGSFKGAMTIAAEVFYSLKDILLERRLGVNVGDEGGFAPRIGSITEALDLLMLAIVQAGYEPGKDVLLALDAAATSFCNNGKYFLQERDEEMDSVDMIEYFHDIIERYPIFSIEDPLSESDDIGFAKFTAQLDHAVQIVGDDLFVTNARLIRQGIEHNIANAVLIKPNQIGTLTEAIEAVDLAVAGKYKTIVSHRSGETDDDFIVHLAMGRSVTQIKTGSLCRMERVAKYNELLRIEEELGQSACYAGTEILALFNNYRLALAGDHK